jgi:hypothetical protein
MTSFLKLTFTSICILLLVNVQAQKKLTYGKSTFTVYQPQPDLVPIPVCGFAPEVPGYTVKDKNYGPGTYYCYAPGNVPKTNYKCILTEIRDWVGYRPNVVKDFAAKKGLVPMEEKAIKKIFKDSRLPHGGLMYKLSETSWIWFDIVSLKNCGPRDWSSNEEYVRSASFIEKVAPQTEVVLDRMYRFWNDGANFADYVGLTQSNFKTQPTAPNDQNPNNFAIGDVLNRKKGFYRLSFGGGAPTYVWHSYEKVVEENLKKSDFDVSGSAGFNDLFTAFTYELSAVKIDKNIFFSYCVSTRFLLEVEPGRTWQQEMASRKEFDKRTKIAMQKTQKDNAVMLEKLYKEIFK